MALVVKDRVQETTNTTGTGTLTLAGAVAGYQSFSVIGNSNTTYYTIVSSTDWEVGVGTYTASGTTLSRDTVLASSASGAKISVVAGSVVFCGYPAGRAVYNPSADSIAIGSSAGVTSQSTVSAIAIGSNAGSTSQNNFATAIGNNAGNSTQGNSAIAIGSSAGQTNQANSAVAIGYQAGNSSQASKAVSIGYTAGQTAQAADAVAIGTNAGYDTQGGSSVAIGLDSGNSSQGLRSIAIGSSAGKTSQGNYSLAIGYVAGQTSQGLRGLAIGYFAGFNAQGQDTVAIGSSAGGNTQGNYAVAIGYQAGQTSQPANSIIINASGSTLDGSNAGFYVNPVRNDTGSVANAVYYNTTSKEVTYGPVVSLTGAGTTSISGTYPNFTITSTGGAGGGDVLGPSSSTANAIALFDGTTGKILQNSGITVDSTDYNILSSLDNIQPNTISTGVVLSTILNGAGNEITGGSYTSIVNGLGASVFGTFNFLGDVNYTSVTGAYNAVVLDYYSNIDGSSNFIGYGEECAVSGSYISIVNGYDVTISNDYTFVGLGYSASITGYSSSAAYIESATISGNYSFAGMLFGGEISGNYSGIGSSYRSNLSGDYSFICGGLEHTLDSTYSTIVGGQLATTRGVSYTEAFSNSSAYAGETQRAIYLAKGETTDATPFVLTADANSPSTDNQVVLPDYGTYFFSISVVARRTDSAGESAAYKFEGCIDRQSDASSTAFVGTPVKTILAEDSTAWDVSISADTTNGALAITVTGETGKDIRWLAKIETVEVSYT